MRARDLEELDSVKAGMLKPGRSLLGGAPDHVRVVSVRADRRDAHEPF